MKVSGGNDISYSEDAELVHQYIEWTSEAVVELRQIMDDLRTPLQRACAEIDRLYELVHNIKGTGSTFDFNLMTDAGTSLCTYLKRLNDTDSVSKRVLEAHVRAFEVVLQHRITGGGGAQGEALMLRLQAIVEEES